MFQLYLPQSTLREHDPTQAIFQSLQTNILNKIMEKHPFFEGRALIFKGKQTSLIASGCITWESGQMMFH